MEELLINLIGNKDLMSAHAGELVRRSAKALLFRMGGQGFTQYINMCLQSSEYWPQREGIDDAHLRPDTDTIRHLVALFKDRREKKSKDYDGTEISFAIAKCGAWKEAVATLIELNGWHDSRFARLREGASPLTDDELQAAYEALAVDPYSPGGLMALGFGQRQDEIPRLVGIINESNGTGAQASAAITALSAFSSLPEQALPAIATCIKGPESRREIAMICNQSGSIAFDTLLQFVFRELESAPIGPRVSRFYEPVVWAIDILLRRLDDPSDLISRCRLRIEKLGEGDALAELMVEMLAPAASQVQAICSVLDQRTTRDYLERRASGSGQSNSRADLATEALKGLEAWDKEQVYATAKVMLASEDVGTRAAIPQLLADLASERAGMILFERLTNEPMPSIRMTIARVIASFGFEAKLTELSAAPDVDTRIWACFVLGFGAPSEGVFEALKARLDDTDAKVFEAAVDSICQLERSLETERLVEKFCMETTAHKRYVLMDAVIEWGDCGDDHSPASPWLSRFVQDMSPTERNHFIGQFENRRKETRSEAEKADRKVGSLF